MDLTTLSNDNLYDIGNEWSPYKAEYDIEVELYRIVLGADQNALSSFVNKQIILKNFDKNNYRQSVRSFIVLLTVAKHAALRAGVSLNIVYSLYDKYAKGMEDLRTSPELYQMFRQAMAEFVKLVESANSPTSTAYSPVINKTIRLITSKFPDKVSLDEAAEEVRLSPKYLSSLFVKETGNSFSDFIQDIRIQYAKQLLRTTNMSLLEITNLLNYSSQSYFTHIFKKKTGMTPKDFKNSTQNL